MEGMKEFFVGIKNLHTPSNLTKASMECISFILFVN